MSDLAWNIRNYWHVWCHHFLQWNAGTADCYNKGCAEQKQSEEQKLLQYDDGNNWYGKDPILCLIHTLNDTEIRCAHMDCHNLSNKCITLYHAKSVEKREMTVWQKMVNVWNDENFAPMTMVL